MASIITHVVVPLAIGVVAGPRNVSKLLLFYACVASMLPDIDVIAFKMGIEYSSPWGHRGFTHSISFAVCVGLFGAIFHAYLKSSRWAAFSLLFLAVLSHGVLDALTNGGLGIAFFWPLTDERFFFPWQPIQVSPIGLSAFLSEWGWRVIQSELLWVWLPILSLSGFYLMVKRLLSHRASHSE